MKKFNQIQFIKKMTSRSSRQSKEEEAIVSEIISLLEQTGLEFDIQKYDNHIPLEIESFLEVDGKRIKCQNNGFVSGKITNNHNIIDSLSDFERNSPNINFNAKCKGISLANFYNTPSLAIASIDAKKIVNAKKVNGYTKIRKTKYRSSNIIVGNKKNPQNIYFTHFDSIGRGAIDNASGVATILAALSDNPESIKNNLFAICGAEELSYDWPVYWGFGYRIFEKKYQNILNKAKKIIVIDGVGHSKTEEMKDPYWMFQAFPIKNFEKHKAKISVLTASIDKLMPVYHSDLDKVNLLEKKFLEEAKNILLRSAA